MKLPGQLRKQLLLAAGIGLPALLAILLGIRPVPDALLSSQFQTGRAEESSGYQEAAGAAATLQALQPWRTDLWVQHGRLLLQAGKWQEALEVLEEAAGRPDFPPEGDFWLGEAYRQGGDPERAIETWEPLVEGGDAPLELYAPLAGLQRRAGDYDGAAGTLRRWKERQPGNARAMLELGFVLALSDPAAAVSELDGASAIDKTISAQVFQLRKALRNDQCGSGTGCRMQTGLALAGLRQWDLAAVVLGEVVETEPENAEAWALLGEARQQSGGDGFSALERAAGLAPGSPAIRALMSLYWRRERNFEKANEIMERLAEEEPGRAAWRIELGNIAAESGSLKRAMEHFQAATGLEPENPAAWSGLARFCLESGMDLHETGLPAARRALLLRPDDPETLTLMGKIFFELGDYASAGRFLSQAVQIDAYDPAAHLALGQVYLESGEQDLAFEHLQKAVTMSGPDETAGILARRYMESLFPGSLY